MRRKVLTLLALLVLVTVSLGSNCNRQKTPTGDKFPLIDSITPNHGCPGTRVIIEGSDLGGAALTFTQSGVVVGTPQVVSRSSTELDIIIPNVPPGSYNILLNGDFTSPRSFTVDSCSLTPTPTSTTPASPTPTSAAPASPTPTSAAPASPTPTSGSAATPTPTAAPGAPVVLSTDVPSFVVDGSTFDLFGSGLGNCSQVTVTFEAGSNSYVLTCLFGDSESIQVRIPAGIPPGTYAVCVTRSSSKGCSLFVITKN